MNHTPEQQWSALSALYEEADGLPEHALAAWLSRLEDEGHPLLPQLRRMLEARDHLAAADDFLATLPRLSGPPPASTEWSAGRRVGPYRLVRPLGEGGMAEVWLAERDDGAFKRQVAIKLPYPRPGRETFAVRFDRERDILASLRHPHIAGLYDAGVTPQGQAWLALEYVEGQPISTYCDERRLSVRERVLLFRQVLLAVQHAHANLVIHRDLKPANILVTPQGEVRLLDFGIAKLLESEGDAIEETELTRQAGRSLTPRYASPEQLTGMPLTTACDVYSLGVVFYELMCGERPYELKVESPAQLEHAILETEPRAPSRRALSARAAQERGLGVKGLRRMLAPELDAIALRCLCKRTAARYSSIDAVLADIDRWLAGEPVLARAPGNWYRFFKFTARHRVGVGLGASAVVALAAVATAAVVLGLQAREESGRAIAARDFMLDLFKRADHEKSRGAEITARELLEAGRKDVAKRLPDQPRLQAELLDGIATIQMGMGEFVLADSTFGEAARIYEKLGLSRQASLAHAAHANNAVRAGNLKLALELLQKAKDVPGRPTADNELNGRLAEIEGWIANMQADGARAKALFQESHRLARAVFGPYHSRTIDALHGLVYAERQLRNYDQALALQQELEAAAARTPALDPKELPSLQEERAELLYSAGRYGEGLGHLDKSIPECARSLGPNEEWCRRLLLARMKVMLRLGLIERGLAEAPLMRKLSEDDTSPTQQVEARLLLLRLDAMRGQGIAGSDMHERVRRFATSGPEVPVNPVLKMRALLALAEAHLLVGQPAVAQEWIERVLVAQRGADGVVAPSLLTAVARSLMGIALLQRHEPAAAFEWMDSAQRDFGNALGPQHPMTQLFSLNAAVALERMGRHADARKGVERAMPILRQSLGSDSPTFQRAEGLGRRLLAEPTPGSTLKDRSRPDDHNPVSSGAMPFDFFT